MPLTFINSCASDLDELLIVVQALVSFLFIILELNLFHTNANCPRLSSMFVGLQQTSSTTGDTCQRYVMVCYLPSQHPTAKKRTVRADKQVLLPMLSEAVVATTMTPENKIAILGYDCEPTKKIQMSPIVKGVRWDLSLRSPTRRHLDFLHRLVSLSCLQQIFFTVVLRRRVTLKWNPRK